MDKMILNEDALARFGADLARKLGPGAVVALSGDLGAGKTTLAKAVADGLGVTDPVSSPTFTLINEYGGGRLPLYHFDLYRLAGPDIYDALEDLGWEDYFYGNGVCVVEWADMIPDLIPPHAVHVRLSPAAAPDRREVSIAGA